MQYRNVGKSGLRISEVALGSWVTDLKGTAAENVTKETVKLAYDSGVNFFDCADAYSGGAAERFLGETLKQYERPGRPGQGAVLRRLRRVGFGSPRGSPAHHRPLQPVPDHRGSAAVQPERPLHRSRDHGHLPQARHRHHHLLPARTGSADRQVPQGSAAVGRFSRHVG